MAILSVQNVTKIYTKGGESVVALDNVNMDVNEGEFIVITGASGSGKTTLLSVCAGLNKPTSGKVYYNDECINEMEYDRLAEYHRNQIGIVTQGFDLLPMMTAYENIILPCLLSKRTVPKKMLDEIVEICGLSERLNHFPSELSGGQKQRVAIARALINSPKIIMADEPTGNLDSKTSESIIDLLLEINRSGKNIMLITHDGMIAKRIVNESQRAKEYVVDNGMLNRK